MRPLRSHTGCEVHDQWHSAPFNREPPSLDSPVSTSDEGAISHGSHDWGNQLETKLLETVWLVFQNITGLAQDKAIGEMKLVIA